MSAPLHEISYREHRRELLSTIIRCTLVTIVAGLVYSVIPIGGVEQAKVLLELVLAVVLFFAVIAFQVRAIVNSDRPQLRAVEVLATVLVSLVVIFAYVYVSLSASTPATFSEHLDRPDGVYFTITVLATVGFGDITPVSTAARMVVTAQMLLNLVVIGLVVRLVLVAAKRGVARRSSAAVSD
jgi:voltage-gated potassium channel